MRENADQNNSEYGHFLRSAMEGLKVRDKFRKLSKIGFSVECFTADFSQLTGKQMYRSLFLSKLHA